MTIAASETLRLCSGARINTETTDLDGVVIETAVVDACTGQVLLDTLVNPGGIPVSGWETPNWTSQRPHGAGPAPEP